MTPSSVAATQTAAVTIVARNYVAQARVLAQSFLAHHPGVRFVTLVIDGTPADRSITGVGEVFLPSDLPMDVDEWHRMAGIYDVLELATAVKPALLMSVLQDGGPVIYFDPDIQVFDSLADAFAAAEEHGIALTPHVLQPLPRDGLETSERTIRGAGIFNLGFIAVGRRSWPFLRWWHERLRRDAVVDLDDHLFTDQRWIDWVPALFEHVVLRDPGLNIAHWNAHERPLVRQPDGRLTVTGNPVRFVHFSGYDPRRPAVLSKHAADRPRVRLSEYPVLADLCAEYAQALDAAEHSHVHTRSYRLSRLPDGTILTTSVRRMYRQALLQAERGDGPMPPNPYSAPEEFVAWGFQRPAPHFLSKVEFQMWRSRTDLQVAFPDPLGVNGAAAAGWFDVDPWAEQQRKAIRPGAPAASFHSVARERRPGGWSVVAYAQAELGVGEAGRRLALAMRHVGLPTELVAVNETLSRQQHRGVHPIIDRIGFRDTITAVNADQLARIWNLTDVEAAPGRRIGLWFWEVDTLPIGADRAMERLDEIWVTSEHTRAALAGSPTPVRVVPLPAIQHPQTRFTRQLLGLPEDRTIFLCLLDFLSVCRRKNPEDTIDAYRRAFGPTDGAYLVVKAINGHHRPGDLDRIRQLAGGRPDIVIRDEYLDANRMRAMVELSDCVVSLHRAEGFGLNLLDAMAAGRPVIATGYSGNLAFMTAETAMLVPHDVVLVGPGADPYPEHAHWAQPDVDMAAAHLRRVHDDPDRARKIGSAGRRHVLARFSVPTVAAELRSLLMTREG